MYNLNTDNGIYKETPDKGYSVFMFPRTLFEN